MATIAWNPGHGWSAITNSRDNSRIGNGSNPSFSYSAPTATCSPLGRDPQPGDVVDFRFSSSKWTEQRLTELGLALKNDIVISR